MNVPARIARDAERRSPSDPVLRNAVSIALATGLYAVSFGVLSVEAGFSVTQTCVMSAVAFTGASQFTFVSLVGSGGSPVAALAPALLLAARNGLYAISLRSLLTGSVLRRALLAQGVIDEASAMAHAQRGPGAARRAFDLTAVLLFCAWNAGTAAGAAAGGRIGSPASFGLDAMFPAVFLALLVPRLDDPRSRRAALAGGLTSLALVSFVPAGLPIIAAAAAGLLVAPRARRAGRAAGVSQ